MPQKRDLRDYIANIDGVLLTGGRANIEPYHFGGKKFEDEIIDPARDYTALNLIKECTNWYANLWHRRGIQEINVAYGGTLIYRNECNGKRRSQNATK